MERYYGNYEKSFERMEKDVVKVQVWYGGSGG